MKITHHQSAVTRRVNRIRAKLIGTATRPRLSVTRSSAHIYAQFIDDIAHKSLLGMSTKAIKEKGTKTQKATLLGKTLAEAAIKSGVKSAIFDRGQFRFHGRLKALADAAREAGLKI